LRSLEEYAPEIILMDIGLPGMDGIRGTALVKERSPATDVVILTVHEDDDKVFQAICAGASGYLLKSATPSEVVSSISEVLRGGAPLSPQIARKVLDRFTKLAGPRGNSGDLTEREREIVKLMVEALTKKQIAERLFLSYHTVDTHIKNIYAKLHVHSRGGAVARALKENLL
jgi:DNA-binding NarL/FixJ family response regulator